MPHNNASPLHERSYDEQWVASRAQTERFRDPENFEKYRQGAPSTSLTTPYSPLTRESNKK